ncbi:MAG: ABC transporter ATP-binding protein, partial [bacterium]
KKMAKGKIEEKVHEITEVVGLKGLENRHPGQMSGGQQQRVALARALVNEPAVLLFDEPLSNLDARLRVSMREEIRRIQKSLGITSVYVTHDQEEAIALSDRIVVLNQGQVEQIDSPRAIYERPATRFTAGFFGKVNFIPGTVENVSGNDITVKLLGRQFEVTMPDNHSIHTGQKVEAVLRPEGAAIDYQNSPDSLNGVITRAAYMGSQVEYEITAQGVEILISEPSPHLHGVMQEGRNIAFRIFAETLHLLPAQ